MFKFRLAVLSTVTKTKHELPVDQIRKGMTKAIHFDTRYGRLSGRPPREIPASFKKYYQIRKDGDITATDYARLIGVSRPTLYS